MYAEIMNGKMRNCMPRTCNLMETYDKIFKIDNLKPYTYYQFQISISNYYTENMNVTMEFTQPEKFQTKIGTPTRPRNVEAIILSPTEIKLTWSPPEQMNGPSIQYEVQYQTENGTNGIKNQMQYPVRGNIQFYVHFAHHFTNFAMFSPQIITLQQSK